MVKPLHAVPDLKPHLEGALGTSLKLWVVLTRAHQAVSRHAVADIARHGLTGPEFGILDVLYHKGPVLLGELQKRVLVSSGGTTFLVDRLVEKGLVERQACPSDRRARYVALTRQGDALIARVFPQHAECIARALHGLSQKDQKAVTALLKRLGLAADAVPVPSSSAGPDRRHGALAPGERKPRAKRASAR